MSQCREWAELRLQSGTSDIFGAHVHMCQDVHAMHDSCTSKLHHCSTFRQSQDQQSTSRSKDIREYTEDYYNLVSARKQKCNHVHGVSGMQNSFGQDTGSKEDWCHFVGEHQGCSRGVMVDCHYKTSTWKCIGTSS